MWVDSGAVATISYFLWEHIGEFFTKRKKTTAQVFAKLIYMYVLLLISCSMENERGEEEIMVNFE